MRTKPQTVTTWRSADLRRWTADARRRRRTPTLAYFRARAQAETLAELRSADEALDILRRAGKEAAIRQFIARTTEALDRALVFGFAGVEATYDPHPIRIREVATEPIVTWEPTGEGWLLVKRS